MAKITFIGAGSTVFAQNLLGDILSYPELAHSEIWLYDIDAERLSTSEIVARKIAAFLKISPKIIATTDRDRALDGADYAINMIQVGGYKPCTVTDFEIPKKYGLRQTIADTLGIGGIMRALRTIPVQLEMVHDMERLCPDVLHLNYVNPMAMNVWALNRGSSVRTVGLCHSVRGTAAQLAKDIGVPAGDINYVAAGINHIAFYLKFEKDGRDLYPEIRKVLAEGRVPADNRVRYDLLKRFGYFVTESSEHFSEYVPWYIHRERPDLIEEFNIPLDEYIRRCEVHIADWEKTQAEMEDPNTVIEAKRSSEYASEIIHSSETGVSRVVYANVINKGSISNLPADCCVEVPCLVDKNGVQPVQIGEIPIHLAALMQTSINVQRLTVEAALTGKREHVYHAAMLDPHTAAELSVDQIWSLVDDLIEEHGSWLPGALHEPLREAAE
ncbi:alpha-galactosidase [Faunimonas pinastri]|uniref:Alpha-galactosidase n=1 Tax=Faunimonas pinastri TaxID=1855383 RepID=A0A1H9IG39_9HYPH|nr:alpha-glucosidase/alpha-galactosidase [Faunimonas pinastri]SEQ73497.1 alpha-galactosidase [Faunimonas pinastri]